MVLSWSGCLWQGGDPGPGGGDGIGPGPVRRDSQAPPPAAAGQFRRSMQDLVAQCFRLGAGQVAVQGQQPQPGQRVAAISEAASQAELILKSCDGKCPIPVSFPVRMPSSTRACTRCAASM